MYVYVIKQSDECVKVGISNDPLGRARALGTASPFALQLVYQLRTNSFGLVERATHRALSEVQLDGEWFRCSPETAIAAMRAAALEIDPECLVTDPATLPPPLKKRLGRPPVTDPFRSVTIQLRASDLAAVAELADEAGTGISTWIRGVCITALRG